MQDTFNVYRLAEKYKFESCWETEVQRGIAFPYQYCLGLNNEIIRKTTKILKHFCLLHGCKILKKKCGTTKWFTFVSYSSCSNNTIILFLKYDHENKNMCIKIDIVEALSNKPYLLLSKISLQWTQEEKEWKIRGFNINCLFWVSILSSFVVPFKRKNQWRMLK